MFVLEISYIFDVSCCYEHVSFEAENDINKHQNTDSPVAVTSDGFDTIFVGTDKRILMISPEGKVFPLQKDNNSDEIYLMYESIKFLI